MKVLETKVLLEPIKIPYTTTIMFLHVNKLISESLIVFDTVITPTTESTASGISVVTT